MNMQDYFSDSAFWVILTFVVVIIALSFQGYWTNWAHKRLDSMREEVDSLKEECDRMKKDVADIRDRNPFTLLKKVNN